MTRGSSVRSHAPRLAGLVLLAVASACDTEQRVIRYNPPLGRLPNAQSGMPVTAPPGALPAPAGTDEKLIIEHADKSVTLVAHSARDLMLHVGRTLSEGDEKLFVAQVLSERTKAEYRDRGVDPGEAFRTLKAREGDVRALFKAMPMGEYTPGAFAKSLSRDVRRVVLTGAITKNLAWVGIDMVWEKGNWRLRWFVPPGVE